MKELEPSKFSRLMTYQRTMRGLSRDAMGDLLGVSGKTIERWEKGEAVPAMDDIANICNTFSIPLEELFKGQVDLGGELDRSLESVKKGIEDLNTEIENLKEQIRVIQETNSKNEINRENDDDLTWLWLLITHLGATAVNFLCYVMSRVNFNEAFYASIVYVTVSSYLAHKKRDCYKYLKMFLVYSVILEINLLLNYVLFADITDGRVINNIELMVINGGVYGFRLFDIYNMPLLLSICLVVYTSWIVFCGYHLIKNRKDK